MAKIILYCLIYAISNVSGSALIKWNLKGRALNGFRDWFDFLFQFQVMFAFGLIVFSALVFFKSLSVGNFSVIIPIATGINFILNILAGYFFFKDSLNLMSFVGFSAILIGIIILSLNNTQHAQ
ncbi:MAG: hypothetical protein K0S33_3559 [Bacteroidetes bacterium]|jgi:multidrug transporter EmrE-like cation transporter|nr:hypothetical protein [Bacteroidota bacterium]